MINKPISLPPKKDTEGSEVNEALSAIIFVLNRRLLMAYPLFRLVLYA